MTDTGEQIRPQERHVLRDLARQMAEIASLPIMAERRALWVRHNRLERTRPLILVFPEGAWRELLSEAVLCCETPAARRMEWRLRSRIYHHAHIHDDTVIEKTWVVSRRITNTGWGVEARHKPAPEPNGAWGFDPVILKPGDLARLCSPTVVYDAEGSQRDLEQAQELLGDILDVRPKGISHISFHLIAIYAQLRGLEQVMWDMHDDPVMLHEAMAILERGYQRLVQQYVDLNLLSLNNDDTYHSSGGVGYSNELPAPGYDPARVRPCDMWASAEAQELAQVSPTMHAEFALPYEKRLLAPFGLNGYGCCEDLTHKLEDVLTIPHIRRISISPFADVARCAENLGRRAIYSWKPHPAHLVGSFSTETVRTYIQHTLDVAQDCVLEMILKDTHTCENHPERFTQWTEIAQALVQA